MDGLVWKAYRIPHLPVDDLPPLSDSDRTNILIRHAFPYLDPLDTEEKVHDEGKPTKRRLHIFTSLLHIFWRELSLAVLVVLAANAAQLASPYVLQQLLVYLESNDLNVSIRPWVWIVGVSLIYSVCSTGADGLSLQLFLAPVLTALLQQQYLWIVTRAAIHAEAIFTQLLLEHALRMRVVTQGQPSDSASVPISKKSSSDSPIGKINNLISSDMRNITRAADFVDIVIGRLSIVLGSVVFLYNILGWR